jgi:hypothetical protein
MTASARPARRIPHTAVPECPFSPTDAYTIRAFQQSGLPDLTTYAVGDDLGGSIMLLVWIPLLSLAIGAIGGALGTSRPRRTPVA